MRGIQLEDQLEQIEFAKRAAAKFAGDPKMFTYTDKDIQPGCLFAMRWGMGDDCVVVFKLDDYFEPTNYHQLIKDFQPPSKEMKAIYQQARTDAHNKGLRISELHMKLSDAHNAIVRVAAEIARVKQ